MVGLVHEISPPMGERFQDWSRFHLELGTYTVGTGSSVFGM